MQSAVCHSRETLKMYLAGWVEPEKCAEIEAHLQSCVDCEQTISGLECDPDTLVGALHSVSSFHQSDEVLQYALAKSKTLADRIVQEPIASLPESAPKSVGPYELIQPLGRGSMGAVYLAKHQQLGKQVAIKLLPARTFRDDQFTARFQREIRAAGALSHPSIVNATDAGQSGSVHYLVMEYLDGMDLSRLARLTGPFSIADACCMMHAVALGLSHAHAVGIVHRDIKPSNLMLSQTGQVKILDFGLAQIGPWDEATAELTTVGQLMGTIDYMAPEQAERADSVDYRADLYSLGATLFRLLCGRAPLATTPDLSPLTKLRLLATSQPPSLSILRPDAPQTLVTLVGSLLSRDPALRPASAAHVAESLVEFSSGADLSKLLLTANEKALFESRGIESMDRADRLSYAEPTPVQPEASPLATRKNGGWGSFGGWVAAASAIAMLSAAGFFMTLETQKGQLVIESVDANAEIKITKAGKVYDSVQLVPGANATKLYAGAYEISIAVGSDRFVLDRETIEIKKGETVIARVLPGSGANQPSPPVLTEATSSKEPVYDGVTLSEWLDQLARDRSSKAIESSLTAIVSLSDRSNRERIAKRVLGSLGQIPLAKHEVVWDALWKVAPDGETFVQQLLCTLDTSHEWETKLAIECGTAILYRQNRRSPPQNHDPKLAKELQPILDWIASNLLSPRFTNRSAKADQLRETGALQLLIALNRTSFDSATEDQYLTILRSNQELGPSFWTQFVPTDGRSSEPRWNLKLVSLLESKGVDAFVDPNTPIQFVAQAAMQLSLLSGDYDRTGMEPFGRSDEIVNTLASRLRALLESPQQLDELIEVNRAFYSLGVPKLVETPFFSNSLSNALTNLSTSETSKCLFVSELLDLVESLRASEACLDSLRGLHKAMTDRAFMGGSRMASVLKFDSHLGGPPPSLQIQWPSAAITYAGETIPRSEFFAMILCARVETFLPPAEANELREAQKKHMQMQRVASFIRSTDKDHDGLLSHDEAPFSAFDKMDTNEDKRLSQEELVQYSITNRILDFPIPSTRREKPFR
jgi:serine/threonine protein kinase